MIYYFSMVRLGAIIIFPITLVSAQSLTCTCTLSAHIYNREHDGRFHNYNFSNYFNTEHEGLEIALIAAIYPTNN